MKWDWALEVWGPRVNAVAENTTFKLRVSGVVMNNPATARSLQLGLNNATNTDVLQELGWVVDTVVASDVAWVKATPALDLVTVTSSATGTRGATNVVLKFKTPNVDAVTGNFVCLSLPYGMRQLLARRGVTVTAEVS